MIASALRAELGETHRAAKTVMRWTGASERTVKHWLSGVHGPGGEYLIVLMRESETVFETVLAAAGRREAVVAARTLAAQGMMVEVMAQLERERASQARVGSVGASRQGSTGVMASDDRENDRVNDPVIPSPQGGLNSRQRWYLAALASGEEVRAVDLRHRWGVSEKTARRDVATLKERGLIEFVGPFRSGVYRLRR